MSREHIRGSTWKWMLGLTMVGALSCSNGDDTPKPRATDLPIVRVYATIPAGETEAAHVSVVDTVTINGTRLVIYGEPIATEQDIRGVNQHDMSPRVTGFQLNDSGTEALRSFTANPDAIQRRIALRFADRWTGFPVVQSEIRNGRFIMLDLSSDELKLAISSFGSIE